MRFIQIILGGIGQVMFQNNLTSGLLFLVGIFYNSWLLGLGALAGTIASTSAAQIMRYPKEAIQDGHYGFNGTLTAIAILCFFELNITTVLVLIVGAALSTLIMHQLKKYISPFTAPFVMATWIVMSLLVFVFNFPLLSSTWALGEVVNVFTASSNSFGQVMFQENVITGLIFLLGILINNKLMAAYAIYAAILGSITGWVISQPISEVNAGLMGYNAILCAIALSGKRWSDFIWTTIAIVLSTVLNVGLGMWGIITLTAPFVLAIWVILLLKRIANKSLKLKTRQMVCR